MPTAAARARPLVLLLALAALCAGGVAPAWADDVETVTRYDDDTDTYSTDGVVRLSVGIHDVARVAAAFREYRRWSLKGINGDEDNSRDFITLLRDVRYKAGGPRRVGTFKVKFDVDLIWPFGSEGNFIDFALIESRPLKGAPEDAPHIDRMTIRMAGESAVLDHFSLTLEASGDAQKSEVRFECRVKFISILDTFFSMARYKKNIEWRIIKVVKNLKVHLESAKGG